MDITTILKGCSH
jgi:hypothetical protein